MAECGLVKKDVLATFQQHSFSLHQAIGPNDIHFLSWKLFSEKMISQRVMKSVQSCQKEEYRQASELVQAVNSALHSNPNRILVFLSILELCEGTGLPMIAEEMRQDLGKRRIYFTMNVKF